MLLSTRVGKPSFLRLPRVHFRRYHRGFAETAVSSAFCSIGRRVGSRAVSLYLFRERDRRAQRLATSTVTPT
ncbi:hypothetical protein V5799_004400 [Amblyomma americanum]|uniref:Uncharacterized protein n=1 Tax=Amblyomma americanum TaxID=6943 RepID=A0AAQ4D676_AMBAM